MTRASEQRVISALAELLAAAPGRRVRVGIGDDAAVLTAQAGQLVWTVDASVEHVHFERSWLSLEDVGWRALQAAASDLAAMGATPLGALVALVLPPGLGLAAVRALGRGQAAAAADLGCRVIGGNVSRGSELSLTTTVLGEARQAICRDTARAGEVLWLVGEVGLARAGLMVLSRGRRKRGSKAEQRAVAAWRRPRALLAEGRRLVGRASALIDVSDGLAGDVARIAEQSGVRIVIAADALASALAPELVEVAHAHGADPLEWALYGGEDYALVASAPADSRLRGARRIGHVDRGRGVFLSRTSSRRLERLSGGFDHFG